MAIEYATLGGGCFWCLDSIFRNVRGVQSVISGYSAGDIENPSYQAVCSGTTEHAEVVQIAFDNKKVSFNELLSLFFAIHDPTTLNRQGADVGTQYRSIILCQDHEQLEQANNIIEQLTKNNLWDGDIVTQVEELDVFYSAEPEHQNYFENNPENRYCQAVIAPKLYHFMQQYPHLLNNDDE